MFSRSLIGKTTIVFALLITGFYLSSPAAFRADEAVPVATQPPPPAPPPRVKIDGLVISEARKAKTLETSPRRWVTSEESVTVRFLG